MADNTTLNTGTGGDVIRDKDRSGVKTQIVALDLNPAGGSETLMSGAMPVTDNGGNLSIDDGGNSITVDDGAGSLTVDNAGTFATQDSEKVTDNAGFTDGTTKVLPAGYIFDDVAGTALTENDAAAARIDSKRAQVHVLEDGSTRSRYATVTAANALKVDASGVAVPITDNSGSLTVDNAGTFVVQDNDKLTDNAAFTDGTTKVMTAGFIFDEVAGTALTENDVAAARVTSNRAQVAAIEDGATRARYATVTAANALKVDASGVAVPITDNSGSITVDQATGSNLRVQVDNASGASAVNVQDGGNSLTVDGTVTVTQGTAAATTAGWPHISGNVARSSAAWTSATSVDTALSMAVTGYGQVAVTLRSTSTITAGTLNFEVSDDGSNWYAMQARRQGSYALDATYALLANDTQHWVIDVAAYTNVRVRLNPAITGSGTVNLGMGASTIPVADSVIVGQPTATNLKVDASGVAIPLAAGSADVGIVHNQGYFSTITATDITRPADTAAYAVNDALSDNTTAASATIFTFTSAARASGKSGIITDLIVISDNDPATTLQGELFIFDSAPSAALADNAAFAITDADAKLLVAKIPFTLEDIGNNDFYHAQNLNIGFTTVGSANLWFFVRVKNAYTPANAEKITFRLKCLQVD